MECRIKRKYDPKDYGMVSSLLHMGNWQSIIENLFEDAEDIINAVNEGTFNSGFGKPNLKEILASRDPLTNAKEIEHLKAHYVSMMVGKNGGDYNKMRKNFLSQLIERVLLDKNLKRIEVEKLLDDDVSVLNHNLYDFKIGLIKALRSALFPTEQISYTYQGPAEFTRLINSTLAEYESRRLTNSELDRLWDTYFQLKFFDNLLEDFDGFVRIKPEFQNSSVKDLNMYVSVNPYVSYDTSFNPNEFASAEQYASEVLKTLLDFFKEGELVDGNEVEGKDGIGFKGFNYAVTRLVEWAEHQKNPIIKSELDKGNNIDWVTLIDNYLKSDSYNKEVAKKLIGLKKILGNPNLDSTIREMINEQRERVVRYQFESYRVMYDPGLRRNVIVPLRVEDSVTESQKRTIAKMVRTKVNRFRKNPAQLVNFLVDHGITVSKNKFVISGLTNGGQSVEIQVIPNSEKAYTFNLVSYSAGDINNDAVKRLVEDLFDIHFPDDYENIFSYEGFNGGNMWNTFREMIMRTLAASITEDSNGFHYEGYSFRNNGIELEFKGTAYSDFRIPAAFKCIMDGTDKITFARNGLGNELPIYQQISAIHKAPALLRAAQKNLEKIRSGLRNGLITRQTIYDDSILLPDSDGFTPIGGIFVRSDYDNLGTNKNSAQMNFKEITYLSVIKSFYHNLKHNKGKIVLQSTCLSDKHTHFMVQYLTDRIRFSTGETLQNILIDATSLNSSKRKSASDALIKEIKFRRNKKTRVQIVNILNRYNAALGRPANATTDESFESLSARIDDFHKYLSDNGYTLAQIQNLCRKSNGGDGIDFKPEADLIELGGKVYINETLYNSFLTYCPDNSKKIKALQNEKINAIRSGNNNRVKEINSEIEKLQIAENKRFTERIERQMMLHAKFMFQHRVVLDANLDPHLERVIKEFKTADPTEANNWIDRYNNTIKVFRLFDKVTGKEIIPNYRQDTFDSQFDHTKYRVELNPIFNGHFYADELLSTAFNDIVFGEDYGVEAKFLKNANSTLKKLPALQTKLIQLNTELQSLKGRSDNLALTRIKEINKQINSIQDQINSATWGHARFFERMEASRLGMHYKRTVHGGATYTPLLQGLKWGVAPKFKVAVVKDTKDPMYSVTGDTDDFTSQDGSGSASPYASRMCNRSYVDGAVGKNKKTIFSYVDPETGVLTLIKWAEFELTNAVRRDSPPDDEHASRELEFKKMHSLKIGTNFNWDAFDISRYYHINGKNVPGITRTKPIFRRKISDVKNITHQKLIKVENNGNIVTSYWQTVDAHGQPINNQEIEKETRIVECIYDFDQVFGGCYVEDYNENGWLDWSEAQNDIVYTIICDEQNGTLKDNFISFSVNASAVKSGMTNVNDPKVYYRNFNRGDDGSILDDSLEELMYFEISSRTGGAQMNADHILTEAEVTEMSQMISALIQAGYKTGTVKEVYAALGQLTASGLGDLSKWIKDPSKEKDVYIWIGEALARSFSSGQGDTLGLAGAFIARANKNFEENGLKTKIPYSANTVKGIFEASITSFINSRAIKHKYPGGGFVQNPTFDVKPRFNFGGQSYSYTELADKLVEYNKKNGTSYTLDYILNNKDYTVVNGSPVFNNPFIQTLSADDVSSLDIDDTIVVWTDEDLLDPNYKMKTVRLRKFEDWDYYRNMYKGHIAKWSIRPKNLLGSRTFFRVGNRRYSLYDLDSVRASLYLNQLLDDKSLYSEAKDFLYNWLLERASILEIPVNPETGTYDMSLLTEDDLIRAKKLATHQAKEDMRNLSKVQAGEIGTFNSQKAFGTLDSKVTVSNVQTDPSQILIGIADAKAFDIEKTSDLEEIKQRGWRFFKDRMSHLIQRPSNKVFSREEYDMVAHGADGSITFVCIGEAREKSHSLTGCSADIEYNIGSDGHIYYKDQDLGLSGTKKFYKVVGGDGVEYSVLYCKSFAEFEEFNKNNQLYSNTVVNYNAANYWNLSRRNEGKTIINPREAQRLENERQERNLERLAKQKFESWEAYKRGIATRIPSQSMQSFTAVEVVGFTDDDVTNVYVSTMLAFLQGSDFDIDKLYIMRYGFTKDGKLATFSNLDSVFNPEKCLDLPIPSKKKYEILFGDSETVLAANITGRKNIVYLNSTRGGLDLIKKILEQPNGSTIVIHPGILNAKEWKEDLYQSDTEGKSELDIANYVRENLEKWVNDHEKTTRYGKAKELATRNLVVRNILKVITDASTQYNLQIPISMTEQRRAADASIMGADEQVLTADNPSAKVLMQIQNMVGRDVIGIGAASLKAFFAVSTYFNIEANNVATLLKRKNKGENTDVDIIKHLQNVVFDVGYKDGLQTLANINFRDAIDALGDVKTVTVPRNIIDGSVGSRNLKNYCTEAGNNYVVDLVSLLNNLDLAANGSWDSPIDAAYSLSGLISAATDNAKELILAKINATSKFADIYTYRLSIGDSFEEIAKFMMSPEFKVIADFAEGYMLDSGTKWFDLEHSVNFVLDQDTLPIINSNLFHGFLTDVSVLTHVFYDGSIPRSDLVTKYRRYVGNNNVKLQTVDDVINDIRRIGITNSRADEPTAEYKKLLSFVYDIIKSDPNVAQVLLTYVKTKIDEKRASAYSTDDYNLEDFNDEDDFYQDAQDEEDEYSSTAFTFNINLLKFADWQAIHRYMTMYLLPKNEELEGIENLDNLVTLRDKIIPGLKEQRMMSKILGVNQGLNTKDFDEYKWVRDVEAFVNERYINSNLSELEIEQFDLVRFLLDDTVDENGKTYKDRQIELYDKVKTTYNILAVATGAEQFNAMLQMVGINRKLIERAYILKTQRKLANAVLSGNKSVKKGLSLGLTQKFNEKEYQVLKNFTQDVILANWIGTIGDKMLSIPFDKDNPKKYFTGGGSVEKKSSKPTRISLNSADGMATFKWLMENYIIDALKKHPDFKNNPFIRGLQLSYKIDPDTGKEIEFYSLDIDLGHVNENVATEDDYNAYLSGFNQIWNTVIPRELSTILIDGKETKIGVTDDQTGDWTIGDLFYLYNLYLNRDGFGQNSLTRIFDDVVLEDDDDSLLSRYYNYICELDSGIEQIPDIDNEPLEAMSDGGDNIITELRIALSKQASAKSKYRSEFKPKTKTSQAQYILYNEKYGKQKTPYYPSTADKNYYLFPFVTKYNPIRLINAEDRIQKRTPKNIKVGSREAIEAIVKQFQRDFGEVIPIITITDEWFDRNGINDDVTRSAAGFIHNGKIYINVSPNKASVGTPIHELMHVFLAALKYGDSKQKQLYYRILRNISQDFHKAGSFWGKLYDSIANKYDGVAVGSDLQEEILVEGLASIFTTGYLSAFGADSEDDEVMRTYAQLQNEVQNIVLKLFKTDLHKVQQTTKNPNILNIPISEWLVNFGSELIKHKDHNLVQNWIPLNQKLAEYKAMLVKNEDKSKAYLSIEGDC